MAHVVSFSTGKFDVSTETPNPINPIAGQSILKWLRAELAKAQYTATEPDTEDWGWYIDVTGNDGSYLVGASADAGSGAPLAGLAPLPTLLQRRPADRGGPGPAAQRRQGRAPR